MGFCSSRLGSVVGEEAARLGRVLLVLVADGITEEDARELAHGTSLDVVVSENQERPFYVTDSLGHELVQAWDPIRLVIESGAAAIELEAIIHRLRKLRKGKLEVEVSKPPALYDISVIINNYAEEVQGERAEANEPCSDELRTALHAIDADALGRGQQPNRGALRRGVPRRWNGVYQQWELPSYAVGQDRAALRARADAGDVRAAEDLLEELEDDPSSASDREELLRYVVERGPKGDARNVLKLAKAILARSDPSDATYDRAIQRLRSLMNYDVSGLAEEARLELARALSKKGLHEDAMSLLDALIREWTPTTKELKSATDLVAQQAHDYALLERARLEVRLGLEEVGDEMYRACLDVGVPDVRASAALELADRLRGRGRADDAEELLQGAITRSATDGESIAEQLEARGDDVRAISAYEAAARYRGSAALRLGILRHANGDLTGAVAAFELALSSRNMLVASEANRLLDEVHKNRDLHSQ